MLLKKIQKNKKNQESIAYILMCDQKRKDGIKLIVEKQNFRTSLIGMGKSKHTVKAYINRFNDFYRYLINELNKFDAYSVKPIDVISYKEYLIKKGQSITTINVKLSSISIYYDLAKLDGRIAENPVPKGILMSEVEPEMPVLSGSDKGKIKEWISKIPVPVGMAFWIMYGAGLRSGEVVKLKYRDVFTSLERLYIRVRDTDSFKDRIVPVVNKEAAKAIKTYHDLMEKESDEPLCNVSKRLIHAHMVSFTDYTGIEFYSHLLRYNIANYLRDKGIAEEFIRLYLGERPKQFYKNRDELGSLKSQFQDQLLNIAPKLSTNNNEDPEDEPDGERGILV